MKIKETKSFGVIPVFKDEGGNFIFCLVKHAEGHWGFPKGGQEIGESEQETAIRELKEETGINDIKLFGNKSFTIKYLFKKDGLQYNKSVTYFPGFIFSMNTATPKDFKAEISEIKWVSYKEAKELITFLEEKNILNQTFEYLNKPV